MFDRIAARYDFINRVLSFGMDRGWRRRAAQTAAVAIGERVLDVGTGTGDLIIALVRTQPEASYVGIDPSEQMLSVAREKIRACGFSDRVALGTGVAESLPFDEASFDVVTIGFGIRNAVSVERSLGEMRRVLKHGGRLVVLEFSLPRNPFVRAAHLFYLRHILPMIGGRLSGNPEAYRYLNKTIETFPHGSAFMRLLENAGFSDIRQRRLCFGAVSIYMSRK